MTKDERELSELALAASIIYVSINISLNLDLNTYTKR